MRIGRWPVFALLAAAGCASPTTTPGASAPLTVTVSVTPALRRIAPPPLAPIGGGLHHASSLLPGSSPSSGGGGRP